MEALENTDIAHYNFCWLKPLDTDALDHIAAHFERVVTVEEGVLAGGFGSAVCEYFADKHYKKDVKRIGIDDCFVEHGSTAELYQMLGIDAQGIREEVICE